MTPIIYYSDSFLGESKTKQYLFLDPKEPMTSCDSVVIIFLLAIFVIQVIEFGHSIASTNVSCIGEKGEALRFCLSASFNPFTKIKDVTVLD